MAVRRTGDPEFADRLRALLERRGESALGLDRRCGFCEGMTTAWLTEKHGPTLKNLRVVKMALGCTWNDLLGM